MSHLLALAQTPDFVGYIEGASYIGVFIWFTVFDFLAPFPDEISLLTVGYLAAQGFFNPFLVAVIPFASFLLTDTISFFLARSGRSIFVRWAKRPKRHSLRAYVARNLERNLPGTVVAVCFIPRMRIWGPLVAGSLRIPYRKFIVFDIIGVGLFVALYTNLGYFFGVSLATVFTELRAMQTAIFVGILFVLGLLLLFIHGKVAKKMHRYG